MSVEKKLALVLPGKFTLVINDGTEAESYFLYKYVTFSADYEIGFENVVLGFMPLSKIGLHSAELHEETIEFVLDVFGKCEESVVALIGDSCAMNRLSARFMFCEFVGYESHLYDVADKE